MSFFETFSLGDWGGGGLGHGSPHHNLAVYPPLFMKLGTEIELNDNKNFVTSLILRDYDVLTSIHAFMPTDVV